MPQIFNSEVRFFFFIRMIYERVLYPRELIFQKRTHTYFIPGLKKPVEECPRAESHFVKHEITFNKRIFTR